MMKNGFSGILFDLDGTLLDTALDFEPAINWVRKALGLCDLSYDNIRPHVSHGARKLVTECLEVDDSQPKFEGILNQLLDAYEANLGSRSQLFQGMDLLLNKLEHLNIPWGVVTNKPKRFTEPLLSTLNLTQRSRCIVSGDTLLQRKPDPAPLAFACHQMQIDPSMALYVGDAERDIIAGRGAGMKTAVALFGYLSNKDDPYTWHADYHITHAHELISIIEKVAQHDENKDT